MAPQMRAVAAGSTPRPIRRRRPATSKTASCTRSPFAGRSSTAWSDAFRSGGRSSNAKTVGAHPTPIPSGCTCPRCLTSPATATVRERSHVSSRPTACRSSSSSAGLVRMLPPCSSPAPPLSDRTILQPRRKSPPPQASLVEHAPVPLARSNGEPAVAHCVAVTTRRASAEAPSRPRLAGGAGAVVVAAGGRGDTTERVCSLGPPSKRQASTPAAATSAATRTRAGARRSRLGRRAWAAEAVPVCSPRDASRGRPHSARCRARESRRTCAGTPLREPRPAAGRTAPPRARPGIWREFASPVGIAQLPTLTRPRLSRGAADLEHRTTRLGGFELTGRCSRLARDWKSPRRRARSCGRRLD
jgi:hypothetical protein